MRVNNCRNCSKKKLSKLFTLGNINYTGKFAKKNQKIKKAPLELSICNNCKLVQLAHKFDLKYMYGPDYGYRSNINHTMVEHLKKVVLVSSKKVSLKSGDMVLDMKLSMNLKVFSMIKTGHHLLSKVYRRKDLT